MCSFEWIGLHFKAIFRRLSGFERPENSPVESFQWFERPEICPVDRFQRERVGRPPSNGSADPRRTGRQAPDLSQGKSTQKCSSRHRNCIFPNLETRSNQSPALRFIELLLALLAARALPVVGKGFESDAIVLRWIVHISAYRADILAGSLDSRHLCGGMLSGGLFRSMTALFSRFSTPRGV